MNFEPIPASTRRSPVAEHIAANRISILMWTTYRWMALALSITGLTAYTVANTPAIRELIWGNRMLVYGLMIAELILVVAFTRAAQRLTAAGAAAMFLGYSVLNGVTLSVIFLAYTQASIAQAFFVSAAAFAALSAYGATTKRDLSPVGQFMFVGLVGLVIASVVNMFFNNPAVYWISTYAGVLIFAGLTAYDNQKLRQMYAYAGGGAGNLALVGALTLYLDFVNMFLFTLRLFSDRR